MSFELNVFGHVTGGQKTPEEIAAQDCGWVARDPDSGFDAYVGLVTVQVKWRSGGQEFVVRGPSASSPVDAVRAMHEAIRELAAHIPDEIEVRA